MMLYPLSESNGARRRISIMPPVFPFFIIETATVLGMYKPQEIAITRFFFDVFYHIIQFA